MVVERVPPGAALGRAAIQEGDVLLRWRTPPNAGLAPSEEHPITSPFEWVWLALELAPRGPFLLDILRDGEPLSFVVEPGTFTSEVRPRFSDEDQAIYAQGARQGDIDPTLQTGTTADDLWLVLQRAKQLEDSGDWSQASGILEDGLDRATTPKEHLAFLLHFGEAALLQHETSKSTHLFNQARDLARRNWGESLHEARARQGLAYGLFLDGKNAEATAELGSALEIQEALAPDSLAVAESLNYLCGFAIDRRDLEAAHRHGERAQNILERIAPLSLARADNLNQLAIVSGIRSDFVRTQERLAAALRIHKQLHPASRKTAQTLVNLATLSHQQGEFETALQQLSESSTILRRIAPRSTLMATTLNLLATVHWDLGDLDLAWKIGYETLALREQLSPEGREVGESLLQLAQIAEARGDTKRAEEFNHRSLAILDPQSISPLVYSSVLVSQGVLALDRQDWDNARKAFEKALNLRRTIAPNSLWIAECLYQLGILESEVGNPEKGLDALQRASELYHRIVPGSAQEARALGRLGHSLHQIGRSEEAAEPLLLAVDALENQVGMLGGSRRTQSRYRARFQEMYRTGVEVLVDLGRKEDAFHLLERSRARSFLAMLAERDMRLDRAVDAEWTARRRRNHTAHDRFLSQLMTLDLDKSSEQADQIQQALAALRREREEIAAEIRRQSPQLSALQAPEPLEVTGAQATLPPGTLGLSFSVGQERTDLFVLPSEGELRVFPLPLGASALKERIDAFREVLTESPDDLKETRRLGSELFKQLLAPAELLIQDAERLLIVPDGPLHRLPFAALSRALPIEQYLIEWKPLHSALSFTVYGNLGDPIADSRSLMDRQFVAFGDPRVTEAEVARMATLRGGSLSWSPLPHTRREVKSIAELFVTPRIFVGTEATEEAAKRQGDARVLHFATHGHLDDRSPLDSGLVLTFPEPLDSRRDNGLLQVWEIFEEMRLNADLVTLSACETGLGTELNGEGLIGLTRAFQYAGARSVLASLWSVSDQATVELMVRFYRNWDTGLPKDEAFQQAQIELLREPITITLPNGIRIPLDTTAPWFWAAFQLFGRPS